MAAELIYKIYIYSKIYLFVKVGESWGETDFTKDFKLRYDLRSYHDSYHVAF